MSILGELQLANGQAWVELFEIDATAQGGDITRFHAGTNGLRQPVVWQGNTYEPFPIMATGFEASGQQMARPKLAVANVNGLISAMLMQADLLGAKVIRRRTMVKYLDDVNFPVTQKPTPAVLTFTRSSTATYYGSDGLLKTAAANQPRIEYDPLTLAVRGLLIEEQRTNSCLWSQEFENAAWNVASAAGLTITTNAITAPDGTMTADKLAETATTDIHSRRQTGLPTGSVRRFSIYAKAAERTQFRAWSFSGGDTNQQSFDLSAGTCTGSLNPKIEAAPDGWWRCSFDIPAPHATVSIGPNNGAISTASYAGTAGAGIYVWGAQCEVGAFATSYIPTTTAAVTRAVDSVQVSNFASIGYSAAEGTLALDTFGQPVGSVAAGLFLSGGFSQSIYLQKSGTNLQWIVQNGGGVQAALSGPSVTGAVNRSALGFAENSFAASTNGAAAVTDSAGTMPVGINSLWVGGNLAGSNNWNGYITRLRYYPRRLTNAELQTVSGGGTVADMPAFELDASGGSLNVYTLAQWNPTADPNSYLPDDIWYISQKTTENAQVVEFELASPVDLEGVMIPGRQIQPNLCAWRYRGEGCGYAGGPVADANDNPTSILANDRCSKRTSGCKLRWGSNAELPFGGFPGAGLVRR